MLGLRPRCRLPLSSSCSRVACAQAAATARVAGKGGIHKAAERDDAAAVRDYLILDASCTNKPDEYKYDCMLPTPACIAIFAMLISCSIRRTPLHWAASHGHIDVVQLLLSCNAAVDARDFLYRPYLCIVDESTLLIFCCVAPLILLLISFFPQPLYPITLGCLERLPSRVQGADSSESRRGCPRQVRCDAAFCARS